MYFVGKLDTLYYSYQTLFANSLGTLGGFMESLKFATPLIFTGLAVAFGFRAGLFNIGAPGQMVLGAIFAALVGVYMPGPRLVVLPLAVIAAALGGGLWGALPGWLKARFGANEVINTILLNYIAASLLLFVLSGRQIFAAPALRIIQTIAIFAVVGIVIGLIPPVRRLLARAPRLSFAGFWCGSPRFHCHRRRTPRWRFACQSRASVQGPRLRTQVLSPFRSGATSAGARASWRSSRGSGGERGADQLRATSCGGCGAFSACVCAQGK